MGDPRAVRVHREVIDRQYSHWCEDCRLPSGVLVWVAYTASTDPTTYVGVFPICDDCEGTNITVSDRPTWEPFDEHADDDPADDEGDD